MATTAKLSKFQGFQVQRINRNQIAFAAYNARTIAANNRAKLKKSLKGDGLVETLVWNRRTGLLVSGHQRLDILDELEQGKDYSLDVAVVDLSPEDEKKLNIRINNLSLQGDYDLDRLFQNLTDVQFADVGFDRIDLDLMFPDHDLNALFTDKNETESVKKDARTIEEMKAEKKLVKKVLADGDDAGFMVKVIFDDAAERRVFLERSGLAADQDGFMRGKSLALALGIDLDKGDKDAAGT